MISKCEHFHQTFTTKYTYKYHVQVVEHITERFRLLIMIHCHRQHVKADKQHDDHIEFLIGDYFEQYCLWTPLKCRTRKNK